MPDRFYRQQIPDIKLSIDGPPSQSPTTTSSMLSKIAKLWVPFAP